jgi:hypothetical protein
VQYALDDGADERSCFRRFVTLSQQLVVGRMGVTNVGAYREHDGLLAQPLCAGRSAHTSAVLLAGSRGDGLRGRTRSAREKLQNPCREGRDVSPFCSLVADTALPALHEPRQRMPRMRSIAMNASRMMSAPQEEHFAAS